MQADQSSQSTFGSLATYRVALWRLIRLHGCKCNLVGNAVFQLNSYLYFFFRSYFKISGQKVRRKKARTSFRCTSCSKLPVRIHRSTESFNIHTRSKEREEREGDYEMAMLFAAVFLSWIHFLRFLTEGEKIDAVFFTNFLVIPLE